jgi:predicted MFS family arabinose efflux permease
VVATVMAAWGFPVADAESATARTLRMSGQRLPPRVWFGVVGVGAMALVQAMVYSFVERMGADRGFGVAVVTGILVAIGVVNMFPSGIAALLERRIGAASVLCIGPVVQAALAVVIASSQTLAPFALAASVFVAVMLFTHTFAFGALARLDLSGRVVAATPAMVMIGSAIGPVLGGTLAKVAGYGAIGVAAVVIDALALLCFWLMTRAPASAGVAHVGPAS